jgi:uncharacterized protein (UPF0261 family)
MGEIWIAGTLDTKAEEIFYLKEIISLHHSEVSVVDLSTRAHNKKADITAETVASFYPIGKASIFGATDRGQAVTAMQNAFAALCASRASTIAGIIGIGGGGGTAMASAGMRALPYGLPKVMVSTLASGDVAPYVDISDLMMVPSVTDLAGLNRLSRAILRNAAMALSGMVQATAPKTEDIRPSVGLTMFGVTTPAVNATAADLSTDFEPIVFHATGTGGRAMERLVAEGMLTGLVDITLTEIADLLVGGVLPARADRLDIVAQTGVPWVGAPGALDMVNFWAPDTVPHRFRDRRFHHHNSNVTLMRTTPDENASIGKWIAEKLNVCDGPVCLLIPERGISALDMDGGPFFDADADTALFATLENTLKATEARTLKRLPLHINDPEFARTAARAYRDLTGS